LLRSEFLFLDRDAPPHEDEQAATYSAILSALKGRPLTLRTLDIGGDKPLRFLALPAEDNPALGMRGIRVGLAHPELLATQLRAALRASADGPLEIMVPMIAGLDEWRSVRAAAAAAAQAIGYTAPIRLGLMIETPAAVLLADRLAAEADFVSIGSNDLTQYILAMDRTNPALARDADALHPAVLRAIAAVLAGARARACPVSLCGGMAGDPLAIPLLVGLGVNKLSVVPSAVPATKQAIRAINRAHWTSLAQTALGLDTAAEVRAFVKHHLTQAEPPR
jgi:phosphocarrier protein FPr/phosphocarrier protein